MSLLIALTAWSQHAQTPELPKILPPTPNAAELVKGTRISTGLFTGTAQFSIPLYTIRYRDVNVPIEINYSSNGVKVDQMASRVGIDWALNAGGVITRAVMHKDDWGGSRRPNISNTASKEELADYIAPFLQQGDIYDTQADEFSYNMNGQTGKFIFDDQKNIIQLDLSNVKIERAQAGEIAIVDFKITDGNGIVYWFGGDQARESTKTTSGNCGYEYASYMDVAWYLNKIIYPNGDVVTFQYEQVPVMTYGTAVSENYTHLYPGQGDYNWPSSGQPSTTTCEQTSISPAISSLCAQHVSSNGVILKSITAGRVQVVFGLSNRDDYGDKRVDRMQVFYAGSLKKDFSFQYTYANNTGFTGNSLNRFVPYGYKRLFLIGLKEHDITGSKPPLVHTFEYNDINGLPPRLSCAQDYGGYFHGRDDRYYVSSLGEMNSDATLLDQIYTERDVNLFRGYGNNKEPDVAFAKKGTLVKINYPTGGNEQIEWEGNTVFKNVSVYPSLQTLDATITGEGLKGTKSTSLDFTINYPQLARLTQLPAIILPDEYDAAHNRATVQLRAPSGTLLVSKVWAQGSTMYEESTINLSETGTYRLTVSANGAAMRSRATIDVRIGSIIKKDSNIVVPGLRVRKITTSTGFNTPPNIKDFYYARQDQLQQSSGEAQSVRYYEPNYVIQKYMWCRNIVSPGGGVVDSRQQGFFFGKLSSNSMFPLYINGQAIVNYPYVTIANGAGGINGLEEHHFQTARNTPGNILHGNNIFNAPYSNTGFMNGLEIGIKYFKKQGNTFTLTTESRNVYSFDRRKFTWYDNYVLSRKTGGVPVFGDNAKLKNLDLFDIIAYPRYKYWIHLDTVYEKVYDQDGINALTNTTCYSYNNLDNLKVTEQQTFGSDGSIIRQNNKYITDFLSENIYQQMNTLHINNAVIEQRTSRGNNFEIQRDQYLPNARNPTFPVIGNKSYGQNTNNPEKRIEYQQYDALGNIQQQSRSGDASEVYLWGYDRQYPVAKILGSDYYTVVALVNDNILQQPPGDQALRDELAKIRTGLAGTQAMVSIYTYSPLVGITSETTPDGRTRYYEYDTFGRLWLVKDHNGKILKQIDYQYQVPVQQ